MDTKQQNPNILRAYAAVDLARIQSNFDAIQSALSPAMNVLAVVKADAYGHDAAQVAKALAGRAAYFGVATVTEGISLRQKGIAEPILIFGRTPLKQAPFLAQYDLTQCVFSFDYANELGIELAALNLKVKIHLKLDTGMGRLGFSCTDPDTIERILTIARLTAFEVEGIFSHYAKSDVPFDAYNALQLQRFRETVAALERRGLSFAYTHIANSAASMFGDNDGLNMVRVGICLYGDFPSTQIEDMWRAAHPDMPILPAMRFLASVAQVRRLRQGDCLGYECSYVAARDTTIAVVAAGYADGVPRALSGKADAICRGCRIVGSVCMDMIFVDITDLTRPDCGSVYEGEIVPLFGAQGISAASWAHAAGTIPYEIYCGISARIPRVLYNGDELLEIVG